MKSLFQNIRAGVITKQACESQLGKYKLEKMHLTKLWTKKVLGRELYEKKLADINLGISLLECIVNSFDDLKLPLKSETQKRTEKNKNE